MTALHAYFYIVVDTQRGCHTLKYVIQWKPLIVITLGPALFDNNNRLITLSGGATGGTIIYQYSTIGEFLPLMEMRCQTSTPF